MHSILLFNTFVFTYNTFDIYKSGTKVTKAAINYGLRSVSGCNTVNSQMNEDRAPSVIILVLKKKGGQTNYRVNLKGN